MPYPGVTFVLALSVAVGVAVYYYFNGEGGNAQSNYNNNYSNNSQRYYHNPVTPVETRKRKRKTDSERSCTICFENCNLNKTLKCGHVFHKTCIDKWLDMHRSCPDCRAEVVY